jgi:outer membrane protein assembly factor BamD (BamD/ComL family)
MSAFLRNACLLLAAASFLVGAAAAEEKPAAREEVGKPVQQAQLLLKQRKFAAALAKLHEADAVKDKTPYEVYVVEETRAVAQIDEARYAEAIKSLDAVLAAGILPPPERVKRVLTQVQLAYQGKDYAGAVAYSDRYYKEGGTDKAPRLLAAQAYYLAGNFAAAASTIRAMLQAEEKAGGKPGEDLILTLASSEHKQRNDAGYRDALTRLVTFYPKKEYWADLLASLERASGGRASGLSDRLALDLDRLKAATGAMDAPEHYTDAAERALAAGLPGDAKAFLDAGYRAGVLGKGAQAGRQKRLADMAGRQSAEDAKTLARLAKEADAAGDGLAWEQLGEAYASYGRHDEAAAAFEKSLKKSGLKHPDDAKLRLGVACLRAGQAAKAKDVLASVSGDDGAAELARLWLIHGTAERS